MDNFSKRRFYLNKKEQNNSYPTSINPDKNKNTYKINNIKLLEESHNRRYLGFNSNTSEVIDNIDNKNNYIRNRNDDIGLNKLMNENKKNIFMNYQNNKDINCFNSSSINNKNFLNRTNVINNGKKYYDSIKKKSDYKTIKRNDDNLKNYNYQKYNENDSKYNDQKYKFKKNFINNYNYTKLFNQSYDYSQYNLFKNNIKEEKRYPVIVVQKKNTYISPNPNFSNYNKYNNKKKIIKIQSNWRGYFLRKIAVGSIKKYIGFVALMKYLEKIMDNNLRFLFLYVINLLRKYVEEFKIRNKYRKINNNEMNNNNRRRYRQFRYSPDINEKKHLKDNQENKNENKNETKIFTKNLFSADFEINNNGIDNINDNNGDKKYKKGNIRNFVNKEKEREREKEERRKDQIERDKDNEKRRIEREERRKEQIEREKEYERRRKERKEEKERKIKEEKERLEKEEKLRKEKEESKKKEKKEENEINDDIFTKPLKIIYVPKRISGAKPLKSRLYFKRLEKDKNIKIEEFIKLIINAFYKLNFPSFIYQLKIIKKSKIIELKLDSLNNIFKLIEIKKLKKYLKIYRDNVLNEKVKEEFLKKNMMKFKKINQKYNNDKKEKKKENNNNIDNNLINENKEKENEILEKNKSEERENLKEENENNDNNYLKKIKENEGNIEDDKNNENEIYDKNKYNLNQKNILKNNDNNDINNEKIKKEEKKIKFNNNLHSPDMEIRGGNKSKKKYIKVKYSKAMTSKTSIGSIKSEGKSNNSLIQTKKMRIKNVVVNPSDYIANILINNNSSLYSSINNNIDNNNNNNVKANSIKLINLIDKIDSKNLRFKYFKLWKKIKNES